MQRGRKRRREREWGRDKERGRERESSSSSEKSYRKGVGFLLFLCISPTEVSMLLLGLVNYSFLCLLYSTCAACHVHVHVPDSRWIVVWPSLGLGTHNNITCGMLGTGIYYASRPWSIFRVRLLQLCLRHVFESTCMYACT